MFIFLLKLIVHLHKNKYQNISRKYPSDQRKIEFRRNYYLRIYFQEFIETTSEKLVPWELLFLDVLTGSFETTSKR